MVANRIFSMQMLCKLDNPSKKVKKREQAQVCAARTDALSFPNSGYECISTFTGFRYLIVLFLCVSNRSGHLSGMIPTAPHRSHSISPLESSRSRFLFRCPHMGHSMIFSLFLIICSLCFQIYRLIKLSNDGRSFSLQYSFPSSVRCKRR